MSNNSYLTIYTVNVTDLANPLILRQLRVENQLLNQISWEDQPFLNQTWVAINNLGAGISAVYSIPYDTSQPITKAFQFDQTFVNSTEAIELVGAGLYNGELCVCVAG